MIHLFVDASAASAGSGPTYVRNVVPQLAARTEVRSTVLLSQELRREFCDLPNVTFVETERESGNVAVRFLRAQTRIPELIRRSGADVLLSAGNIALFRSPVPQILLSGNALYTSGEFLRDIRRRRHYQIWLDTKLKSHLAKWSVKVADCTVAPSKAFADEIGRWTGVRARAIHHGFDRDVFFNDATALPEELQARLARKDDELRLLFVSHYNYYRNFETLFRALPLLKKSIRNRKVTLFLTCRLEPGANPGSYRPEHAAALVRSLGIGENVVQLGAVLYQLVHQVYRSCDIYVSPSYVETFAHPLVEAMAAGLPVVASDLTVHREICGEAALYFPFNSSEILGDRIQSLAGGLELASQLSARGRQRSMDFCWSKHTDQIVALAKELILKSR